MSDDEPLLQIDRYESFIRDENELRVALDYLTKAEDVNSINSALSSVQNSLDILQVDLNGMTDTEEYPDLEITFTRLQDQARRESAAARVRMERVQLFSMSTLEEGSNGLKHRTPSSSQQQNISNFHEIEEDTSTIQLREIERKLASATNIGEDSLLTLQAQEEQFKKIDRTINKISRKAKSSKSVLRSMRFRHCYQKTLFTWFLIVLVLCCFILFAWYIGSPEPIIRKLQHPASKATQLKVKLRPQIQSKFLRLNRWNTTTHQKKLIQN